MKWLLFDVYKVAAKYPLEISLFATIFAEEDATDPYKADFAHKYNNESLRITDKFQRKSTRLDLKGLSLDCGLVASIQYH